jgi:DNA-binding transcriptional LysR family regulator
MDRLATLEAFVAVVENGGFAAAARQLGVSATMAGKHISVLELHLGTRLLNRTTRRQSLTEAGSLYYDRCKKLLAQAAEADAAVQALRQFPRGLLRIAAPVTFGSERLAPALATYLERYREVAVELTLTDRAVDLVKDGYDAAIRVGPVEDSRLVACPLQDYPMLLCASPAYVARHGQPARPQDLSRHACLGFAHWDRRGAWRLSGPDGKDIVVKVHYRLTVNHGGALRKAALAGMGIVMQPEALLAADLEVGHLVRILPQFRPPTRPMTALYLSDRRGTPKLKTFIQFLREKFPAPSRSRS